MSIDLVKKKYEEMLMNLPGVVGVGIGLKSKKKAIKVFVGRLPEERPQPEQAIPKSLDGYEVDVEEIGTLECLEKRRGLLEGRRE